MYTSAAPSELGQAIVVGREEAHEAAAETDLATRAYGSLIDLYPGRSDMRRVAGTRLEGLGSLADSVALDTYGRARSLHPSNPTSHRLLAFAHVRNGRFAEAFVVLASAIERDYPARFGAVHEVLDARAGDVHLEVEAPRAAWRRCSALENHMCAHAGIQYTSTTRPATTRRKRTTKPTGAPTAPPRGP